MTDVQCCQNLFLNFMGKTDHLISFCNSTMHLQVAVPPGPKALNWFCCQLESSRVFPQFFVSKEAENPSCKSLYLNRTRGVFGIGAAIYFIQSSHTVGEHKSIRRFILFFCFGDFLFFNNLWHGSWYANWDCTLW